MLPKELLKKIKRIELKTRKVVQSTMSGEYHSVFKGRGINFAEVREYQPGDDIRTIDWNVTARAGSPFVKVFEEERELTVLLAVDLSASGFFGSEIQSKLETVAEVAATLAYSATSNNDRVGLVLFSDKIEAYIPPKKGPRHVLRLLRDIFYFKPERSGTSISTALEFISRILKKRAIVFVLSDFMDTNYEKPLRVLSERHDVIPIQVLDHRETVFPKAGRLLFEDMESGEKILLNTSSSATQKAYQNLVFTRQNEVERLFQKTGLLSLRVFVGESFIKPLVAYFKSRSGRF